jgi:hypothetical protein
LEQIALRSAKPDFERMTTQDLTEFMNSLDRDALCHDLGRPAADEELAEYQKVDSEYLSKLSTAELIAIANGDLWHG